jgi:hypothetical protein
VATDLFGRPTYDTPRANQPDLFGDWHWFRLGYEDAARPVEGDPGKGHAAYTWGCLAGADDVKRGRHSAANEEAAWRSNRVVGNVRE